MMPWDTKRENLRMPRLMSGWTSIQKCYAKLHKTPNLKYIGTQLRGALSADRINWGAVLYDVEADVIHRLWCAKISKLPIALAVVTLPPALSRLCCGKDPAEAVAVGAAYGIKAGDDRRYLYGQTGRRWKRGCTCYQGRRRFGAA